MNNEKFTPEENDQSAEQLESYAYSRGMGAYKAHFAGVPENYYPLNCKEITVAALILIFTIGGVLGIMIGFLYWVQAGGLEGYVIAWVAVFLTFLVVGIILFYIGGKARRRMEKELIAENNRKQQEMIHGKQHTVEAL